MSENPNLRSFYAISMITSVIGGILLLFTDFAGWDGSNYYLGFYEYGYIGSNLENPLSIIPFLILAVMLFYGTYISFLGFQGYDLDAKKVNIAFILSLAVLIVVLIGALIFLVSVIADDVWWWFDAGFYGGLIGSALTVVMFRQIKNSLPAK